MGNLSWGMRFRTCKKFRAFEDIKSSLTPEIFHKYKSHTAITSIVDSAFAESATTQTQNSTNPFFCKILRFRRISHARCRIPESRTKCESSQKFLLLFAFAKSRIPSFLKTQINQRFHNSAESKAESTLDSTQNRK